MYRTIEDFINDWNYESEATLKVFGNVTDEAMEQRVTPEGRSLGFLMWHITLTPIEMLGGQAKIPVDGPALGTPAPQTAAEITATYARVAEATIDGVKGALTDEKLTEMIPMYGGEMWSYGATLQALVHHQAHHRGQITVLMRQAGLPVPGVYGPSREEWIAYGM